MMSNGKGDIPHSIIQGVYFLKMKEVSNAN
jgi:hypothetical protein